MSKFYIANAFSFSMISASFDGGTLSYRDIDASDAASIVGAEIADGRFVSGVGHPDTAVILSNLLGANIPSNRVNIKLEHDDILLVAQYNGPRLPEGTTVLPEGAEFRFILVTTSK
jgi:hypothetical protein